MQETLPLTKKPEYLSFSELLTALMRAFDQAGLRPCILRNYEGFPSSNVGSDVDFLIHQHELALAIRAVQSIQGIRIVGYAERHYVAHLFVEGVSATQETRALGLDFIWNLNWKGLPYLATSTMLDAAIERRAGELTFLVPSPIHEAIISLLSSLLIGGWLKEKYFPRVQQTFQSCRLEVIGALSPGFGPNAATRLADSVIDGNREMMVSHVGPLRVLLALRGLPHRPVRGILGVARYYVREFAVRCTPKTIESVCIMGPYGCGKAAAIEGLIPMLQNSAKLVEKRNFGPQLSLGHESLEGNASAESKAEGRDGSTVTAPRIVCWLAKEWLGRFKKKNNLTLRIFDGSYFDLLADPQRFGYKGPRWFARLAEMLLPSFDLWILLDPAEGELRSETPDSTDVEALRQLEAYRAFVVTRKRFVILNASKTAANVTEDAYAAIVDMLAQRAERQLKKRF